MLNENQHKLLAKENIQKLVKAFECEPADFGHTTRAAIHKRVDSWITQLSNTKFQKREENKK